MAISTLSNLLESICFNFSTTDSLVGIGGLYEHPPILTFVCLIESGYDTNRSLT
ncbi:MAG: hypothetical protein MJ201_01085 [Mycoplasmoidaceae bacterium]|nr:hypothetical protein [Mycoplasmoidaceae bacterium]